MARGCHGTASMREGSVGYELWKSLPRQWRTNTRRCTGGKSSARLLTTPGSSTSGASTEVVPRLHCNISPDIRVGSSHRLKKPKGTTFAIGRVLVAKTRLSPGFMAAVGRPARNSGAKLSWSGPLCSGPHYAVAPPFSLVPAHPASLG